MASYKLSVDSRVRKKDMPALPRKDAARIAERIAKLAANPRPRGAGKLAGHPGYRLRQGKYRVLYEVDDGKRIVTVRAVAHRRKAYR